MSLELPTNNHTAANDLPLLRDLASKVGTPFWVYDAAQLRRQIDAVRELTDAPGLQARFAMKACPATRVLQEIRNAGIWIDAVSGNEALRAIRAGFDTGSQPPIILYTADVFRDNGLKVLLENSLMPNVGSPGMVRDLASSGYNGPIALRINPGFGHGHVNACDTGGPSSKHGIWFTHAAEAAREAEKAGLRVAMLHSHVGSGPKIDELLENLDQLAREFAEILPDFPDVDAVSLGGGIPHDYRAGTDFDLAPLGRLLKLSRERLCNAAGREIRVEIEPGRFFVASTAILVTSITDVKFTETNTKGPGAKFAMVDAGFVDLLRPAMYGSFHRITLPGRSIDEPREPVVVAGPLCESGDVFTRDSSELLAPRSLPKPNPGDLLVLHDAGAYGYAMSSNYNSIGRAPQVMLETDGAARLISRRETVDDLLRIETDEKL
ncbi:MAG TPA: diaminopimelate decarboxylase [Chthoniobacterales bacterium]